MPKVLSSDSVESVKKESLVDIKFCAEFLSASKEFVRKEIGDKKLKSFKIGDLVRVKFGDLKAYRDARER